VIAFTHQTDGYARIMDRGSSKRSRRLDDAMARETEVYVHAAGAGSRAGEWQQAEPSGDDQPQASFIPGHRSGEVGAPPAGSTPDEQEEMSRIGRFLPRGTLPGDRVALLAGAMRMNAPDGVLEFLDVLDPARRYRTVAEVWAALGHPLDRR
jgi:hypothetical protein